MEPKLKVLSLPAALPCPATLTCIKVQVGDQVRNGTVLATYTYQSSVKGCGQGAEGCGQGTEGCGNGEEGCGERTKTFKSTVVGKISSILQKEGDVVEPSAALFQVQEVCDHSIVVFDLCTECGLDLRSFVNFSSSSKTVSQPVAASVSVIHGIPELRVSQQVAEQLGNKDRQRLLSSRKLTLIVDLDQTLVHTSVDPNIEPGLPDVYGFQLPDHRTLYHCRLRPHTREFLEKVSRLYELHVFTMGNRSYAGSVTRILDPDEKLFRERIISRDECVDPHDKTLRLKDLFPCGDSMVAIIDDRENVWGRSPNLIHVKPYLFFSGTADINAPAPRPRPPRRPEGPYPTQVHPPTHIKFRRGNLRQQIQRQVQVEPRSEGGAPLRSKRKIPEINDPDVFLVHLADLLERIHQTFYERYDTRSGAKTNVTTDTTVDDVNVADTTNSACDTNVDDMDTANTTKTDCDTKVDTANTSNTALADDLDTADTSNSAVGNMDTTTTEDLGDTTNTSDIVECTDLNINSNATTNTGDTNDTNDAVDNKVDTTDASHADTTNTTDTATPNADVVQDCPIPDLNEIIPELRRSVLKDCRILFTGVIPTNMPVRKNQEWNTARAFGATIHSNLVPGLNSSKEADILSATTHVIAGKPGTSKMLEARRLPGIKVVNPRWLWACAEQWRKVDEEAFPVESRISVSEQSEKQAPAETRPPESAEAGKEKDNGVQEPSDTTTVKAKTEHKESDSDSDSSSEGDIFNREMEKMARMDTDAIKRHLSYESRLSVSDHELEQMDAEVEAEISSSEESSEGEGGGERERLGSHMEDLADHEDSLSYEKFAGTHVSQDIDVLERLSRKRKFADLESTGSSSGSATPSRLNESVLTEEGEESDEEDELGALLGF